MVETKRARLEWVDILKGIAIICVVFEHACERTNVYIQMDGIYLDIVRHIIMTFQMAIFFCISGYLFGLFEKEKLERGDITDLSRFLKRKIIDLLIPYTIFGVLIWLGKLIFSQWVKYQVGISDLLMIYIKPISFAWFLYALFLYEAVTSVIAYLFKVRSTYVQSMLGIFLIFLTNLFVSPQSDLYKPFLYYFLFVLGILLRNISVNRRLLLCGGGVLYVLIFSAYYVETSHTILFAASCVTATTIIFLVFKDINIQCDKKVIQRMSFLGCESMYIYVLHPVIEHGFRIILVKAGIQNLFIWIFSLTVVGIIVPSMYAILANKCSILAVPFKPRKALRHLKN